MVLSIAWKVAIYKFGNFPSCSLELNWCSIERIRIEHLQGSDGIFTARHIGKGSIVGHYYVYFVHEYMGCSQSKKEAREQVIMAVTKDAFTI